VERLNRQRFVLEEGHPLSDGYDVVHCATCGFVYADVAATQADYDAFYARMSKYEDAASSTGSGESAEDRARLRRTAEIVGAELAGTGARILDIGCAGGGLLHSFREFGYRDLVGVDPSAACARMTRERTGEAYHAWITSLPREVGTFDCVILSHVLEHVLDVASAIQALEPLLKTGARVFLETPDAVRYADHIYAPFQDFNTEHINHFSAHSLDNAMESRGYRVLTGGERLLQASSVTFTPAVYRIYERTGRNRDVARDETLRPAILRYIQRSAALLESIDAAIRTVLQEARDLVVWGVGQLTLKLLAETCLGHARVAAFVDSNPIHHGRRLAGAPIIAPGSLGEYRQPILVGTTLHHREIAAQIQRLGLPNRVVFLPEGGPKFFGEAS
jgi:2-polyprenyl-3-methyl-5-hydroxy-6-metoxy-1,4-benzoquinol methylase